MPPRPSDSTQANRPLAIEPLESRLAPSIDFSIADRIPFEGDGATQLVFTVTRSGDTYTPVQVQFRTVDGTALAGVDYVAESGIVQFAAGSDTATFDVALLGDLQMENSKEFSVELFDPAFAAPYTSTTVSTAGSFEVIETGDLNNDGKIDLVYASRDGQTVAIRLNQTDPGDMTPTYSSAYTINVGTFARDVAIGDIDRDGRLDLVVAAGADVKVYRNTTDTVNSPSSLSFVETTEAAGSATLGVALGDINGDGLLDIAATDSSGTYVLINQSTPFNASFKAATSFATGSFSRDAVFADIDLDGKQDLIVISQDGTSVVSVLRNTTTPASASTATAAFASKQDFSVAGDVRDLAVRDLNGDGLPDIIVASTGGGGGVTVLENTTSISGGFPTLGFSAATLASGSYRGVAVADVNFDGKLDVLASNYGDGNIGQFLSLTAPGAAPRFTLPSLLTSGSGPAGIAVGDINGDGRPDIVATNYLSNSVSTLLNDVQPDPNSNVIDFRPVEQVTNVLNYENAFVVWAQHAGSSLPDLLFTTTSDTVTTDPGLVTGENTSIVNGLFQSANYTLNSSGSTPRAMAVGNLGNGPLDEIVFISEGSSTVTVLASATPLLLTTSGSDPKDVDFADVNGDGKLDVVVADGSGQLSIFLNTTTTGPVSYGAEQVVSTIAGAYELAFADLNKDGKLDIVVGSDNVNAVAVLRNTTATGGSTVSFSAQQFALAGDSFSVAVADINDDGKVDIVTSSRSNQQISVLLNETVTAGTTFVFATPTAFASGAVSTTDATVVAVADIDGDGRPDIVSGRWQYLTVFRNTTPSGDTSVSFAGRRDIRLKLFQYSSSDAIRSLTIADANGDGRPDIGVGMRDGPVQVFINDSSYKPTPVSFGGAQTIFNPGRGYDLASGDINGDGRPDVILVADESGLDRMQVALNTAAPGATPTFTSVSANVFVPPALKPRAVAVGDINGDGKLDVVVASHDASHTLSFYVNTTTPGLMSVTFTIPDTMTLAQNAESLELIDVNLDGKLDLVATFFASDQVAILLNQTGLNSATAVFAAPVLLSTLNGPLATAWGDFNNDGRPDLAVAQLGDSAASNPTNAVSVFMNGTSPGSATLTFLPRQTFFVGNYGVGIDVADVNGDGRDDIVSFNIANAGTVLLNQTTTGAATATFFQRYSKPAQSAPNGGAAADLNGDGLVDVVTLGSASFATGSISVALNNGQPGGLINTAPRQSFFLGGLPSAMTLVDLDGNGFLDVVSANLNSPNQGDVFALNTTRQNSFSFSKDRATVTIVDDDAPTSILIVAGNNQSADAGDPFSTDLQVQVVNLNGSGLAGYDVHFTSPSADAGHFSPSEILDHVDASDASGFASAAFVAGTKAFTYQVAVTIDGVSGPIANFTLTNLASGATQIAIVQGDSQQTVVDNVFAQRFQVELRDQFGNLVDGEAVRFTSPASDASGDFDDGFGGLTRDAIVVAGVTGSVGIAQAPEFTANQIAGSYIVTASLFSTPTINVQFNVQNLADVPASFLRDDGDAQDVTVAQSAATNLAAKIVDQFGNPLEGIAVTFTAPVSGASGLFDDSGSGSNVLVVNTDASGIATAPTFTANTTPGSYIVTASAAGFTDLSFNLTNVPDVATEIVIIGGADQATTVAQDFAAPFAIELRDQFGNPVLAGVAVTFSAPASGASGLFDDAGSGSITFAGLTDALGQITAPQFAANQSAGSYLVSAVLDGNNSVNASFAVENLPDVPDELLHVAGDGQSTVVTQDYATDLAVQLVDQFGNPLSGIAVTFTAPGSGASGLFDDSGSGSNTIVVFTDAGGIATAPLFTANQIAGSYLVTASSAGVADFSFALTNLPDAPAIIVVLGGDNQAATVAQDFTDPFEIEVRDQFGNPVLAGIDVTFSAPARGPSGLFDDAGAGSITFIDSTDASGRISAPQFTANQLAGSYVVSAVVDGDDAVNVSFQVENLPDAPADLQVAAGSGQSTKVTQDLGGALVVTIVDQFGNPLEGVAVTFTAPASGPGGLFDDGGAGSNTIVVFTDASGNARTPGFAANRLAGSYVVTASAASLPDVSFALTNVPFTLTESLTFNQSYTIIGSTGSPTEILSVKIFDGSGNLVNSVQPFDNVTSLRVATGDFNGDGAVDEFAVMGRLRSPGTADDLRAVIVIYSIDPSGNVTETSRFFAFAPGILGNGFIAAGDFDGDGDDELAVAQIGGGRTVVTLQIHFGNGGSFTPGAVTTIDFGTIAAPRIAAGDTDGDGKDEIVVAVRGDDGARILIFDADTGTPARKGNGFTWDFGIAGYARGAFVAVGEFDPTSPGAEIVLGSNVGGNGRIDIVSYDGADAATLIQNGRLTPFGPDYNAAVRVAVGRLDDRNVIVAGQDRFQSGQYTIMAPSLDTTDVIPPFETILAITALPTGHGPALGPFVAFANLTLVDVASALLSPGDLPDGDADDIYLALAVYDDRAQVSADELDELFAAVATD